MPVWGSVYRVESDKAYDSYLGQYFADDGMIRARVLALIDTSPAFKNNPGDFDFAGRLARRLHGRIAGK